MILRWKGEEFLEKIAQATADGVNDTTTAAAEDAAGTTMNLPPHVAAGHPWYGVTSRVESAVSTQAATAAGTSVRGAFGATKRRGDYALFLERLNPYLRPAADRNFPKLPENIRKRLLK